MLAGIFLFSFSALAYEIVLIRVFSISLWYHFAFMVISIAMLGIGASGAALSIYPKLRGPSGSVSVSKRIGIYGMLLGGAITISYILSNRIPFDPVRLSWDRIQLLYICVYYLLLSAPFFFFGLSVSTAFSALSGSSGLIYGSDLLGAGAGSVMVLYLLSVMAPEYAIVLVSSVALSGALVTGGRDTRLLCGFLVLFNISLFFMPGLIGPRMSPYKGLQLAMQYPGSERIKTFYSPFSRVDTFRSPSVRFAPGLSLRYLDDLPQQIGISVDGADINAITYAKNEEKLAFLRYLPSALPYTLGSRRDVLILEPAGGLEILLARYYEAKKICKADSNPLVIRVIRDEFGDFSQGIYDNDTWAGIGRSWLKARGDKFDVIDIPLTGTSPSGSFGIAEDYRFTVEAFKEYLGHLKEDGVLSIHLFILPPPRMELRLLNTLASAMEEMGIKETGKRIVSIRSWGTISILAKVRPFTRKEIEAVRKFSREMRFDLVHLPGISEEETNVYVKMPSNEYFGAFKSILELPTRESFQRSYIFDIRPVHDEDPFFHYYLKLGNVRKIYDVMGGKWQFFIEEGYILPAVFIQVLLLSIALIILPTFSRKSRDKVPGLIVRNEVTKQSQDKTTEGRTASAEPRNDFQGGSLLYFAFLGLGFMFVEIPLIQKMILPLENPPYAVAAVLTSLLIGSGAGSLLSERFSIMSTRLIIPLIALLIAAYSLFLPSLLDIISLHPMAVKIVYVFLLLTPLSLSMGIPFPLGIRNLGDRNPDMIPWAWAINGCLSVMAPVASVMLAMVMGFKGVFWIGASAYLLAFLTFPKRFRNYDDMN